MKEHAELQQKLRDHKMKQLTLLEKREDNNDEMRELLLHIEYLKKDILQTGKRHINYLTL